jgi:hypothetical protein
LCALKGCENLAAWVPYFRAYASLAHGPERAATSGPISTLAHCSFHKAKHTKLSDILGHDFLEKISRDFTASGKARPVRLELCWIPVS